MKTAKLEDTYRGWFIGDFASALFRTEAAEVAVKHEKPGEIIPAHVHRVVTEITAVVSGTIRINDRIFGPGDLIVVEPGETARYECIEQAVTVVVKLPGLPDDKTLV